MRRWTIATPIVLSGVVFLGIGIWFVTSPGALGIIGINAVSAAGRGDLRAVYGGLQIAIGLFLLTTAYRHQWHGIGLAVGTAAFAGLAGGRTIGFALESTTDALPWMLYAAEILGLALCAGAWAYWWAIKRRKPKAEATKSH